MTHYAPATDPGYDAAAWTPAPGGRDRRAYLLTTPRFEIARDWLTTCGSVLIFGGAGTGKSTMLDAVVAGAGKGRILRCTPPEAGVDLPFFGLADLLSSVTEEELGRLPAPHRRVLRGVLMRAWGTAPEATPAVTRVAALQMMRILARSRPLLLVVDDTHRLDRETTDLLQFVAKRVDDVPIWMAAAERVPDDRPPLGRPLCPPPLLVTGVEPTAW